MITYICMHSVKENKRTHKKDLSRSETYEYIMIDGMFNARGEFALEKRAPHKVALAITVAATSKRASDCQFETPTTRPSTAPKFNNA